MFEHLIPTPMKTSALISRKQTGESIPSFKPTALRRGLTQVLGVEKPGKIKERKGCSCVQRACPSVSIGLRACRFVPLWPLRNVRSCCNVWAALIASAKALVVLALAVPTCCAVASPNSGVERPLSATTTDCSWPIVLIRGCAHPGICSRC